MPKDKIILAELDFDTRNLVKAAQDTKKEMEDLVERQEKLSKKGKETSAEFIRNEAMLKSLTQAYEEQSNAIAAHVSQTEKMGATFNDFKSRVGEAFASINVFNGGLGDFLSRAEEAGGTGKLFKGAIDGMATGIKGMGAAIKANPIGFLLSLIAPLIEQFKQFAPLTNAVEKAMAGLAPILDLASKPIEWMAKGITFLINGFSSLLGSMSDAADEAMKLRDAEALLNTEMVIQEERNDKAKRQIDDLIAKSQDQTLNEKERLQALQDAAKVEMDNYNERKRLSEEAYRIAAEKLMQDKDLSDEEMQILQNGTAAQIAKLQETRGITAEELKTLQDAKVEKQRIANEEADILDRQAADEIALQNKIKADNDARDREADRKRKEQQDKAIEHQRQKLDLFEAEKQGRGKTLQEQLQYEEDYARRALKILDNLLSQQKITLEQYQKEVIALNERTKENQLDINRTAAQLELDQYIADQGYRAKTLAEEVEMAEEVARRKKEIAQMEYDAHRDNANALAKFNLEKAQTGIELDRKKAEFAVDNARREFVAFKENEKNQLSERAITDDIMLKAEKEKLDAIFEQESSYQRKMRDSGLIDVQAYQDAIKEITLNTNAQKEALDEKFEQDKKTKEAIDLENKRLAATANMEYDLATQLANLQAQKDLEIEAAEKTGASTADIDAKYAKLKQDTEEAVMNNKLQLANQTFGNIAAIVGKESAVGKAMAVAQATIDTYQAATAAYKAMAGIPVVGPALGGVAAAAAVAAGIQNVKKITGTKTPKAEKGALFSIGGQRHSAGGTLFTGADGTRFEAEQGELIGVMNRNAARHFMAFNNAFPAGSSSAPNYFANGGIVSREIAQQQLNVDELASKIAMANAALPQPVVAVHDIITQGNSYVQVRDGANF